MVFGQVLPNKLDQDDVKFQYVNQRDLSGEQNRSVLDDHQERVLVS